MSSFLIQNRFSATLSPRCNPRAADLRILLRITLEYLKIVSKFCNSQKNIEVGFSRERPPQRPHGPRAEKKCRESSQQLHPNVPEQRGRSISLPRSEAYRLGRRDGSRRALAGSASAGSLGPLGPLWGRSLENPTPKFFCELQNVIIIFEYFNVIRHRIRKSAALSLPRRLFATPRVRTLRSEPAKFFFE